MADGDVKTAATELEFRLSDLRIGQADPRGHTVHDILWTTRDLKIYKTDAAIGPMFSDDPALSETQRRIYLSMGPRVAEFNHLIRLLQSEGPSFLPARFGRPKANDMLRMRYEREFAMSVASALTGNPEQGSLELESVLESLSERISGMARMVHMLMVVAVGFATIVCAELVARSGFVAFTMNLTEVSSAIQFGCMGVLFSTTARLQDIRVDRFFSQAMNWIYAMQRTLVGILSAFVLYVAMKSGIAEPLMPSALLPKAEGGQYGFYQLAFVCIVAGFSERLVPNMLVRHAERTAQAD